MTVAVSAHVCIHAPALPPQHRRVHSRSRPTPATPPCRLPAPFLISCPAHAPTTPAATTTSTQPETVQLGRTHAPRVLNQRDLL